MHMTTTAVGLDVKISYTFSEKSRISTSLGLEFPTKHDPKKQPFLAIFDLIFGVILRSIAL